MSLTATRAYDETLARYLQSLTNQEAEMCLNKCALCKQELPTPELKAGDLVTMRAHTGLGVVPSTPVMNALLRRFGPKDADYVWVISLKNGELLGSHRDETTLVHGFFRITERV